MNECCRSKVLDARDPEGTRCRHLEKHLKENGKHKHLIFILNKVGAEDSSPHCCGLTLFMVTGCFSHCKFRLRP